MKARLARWIVGQKPRRTLVRALVLAAVCFVVFRHAFRPVWVDGDSMAPTVRSGTFRFANLLAFVRHEPRTGDIVVIEMAGRRVMYLKRILAVPGERFAFTNGVLYVDGRVRPEPYVVFRGRWTTGVHALGPDQYYVAGDNRDGPIEGHATGIVERWRIAGGLMF